MLTCRCLRGKTVREPQRTLIFTLSHFHSHSLSGACHRISLAICPSASQAMLILSCSSKLRLLEGILRKNLFQTLPVASDDLNIHVNTYAAFYWDLDVYRTLLQDTDAVNWAQNLYILGNQDGILEASREAAAVKKVQFSADSFITYMCHDPNKYPEYRLDPGFTLSSLNSSHVDLLNETWHYGGNEQSHRYLASLVRHFPSACILDVNGLPISWNLMNLFGTMVHGYTLPSHRRKGYLAVVAKALAIQVHAAGYPVYSQVALDNNRTHNFHEKMGYERLPELCHFCFHFVKEENIKDFPWASKQAPR
ncbi:glycine N-acyltransferase-like protein 3 isoform X2 [Hemicordylus capensis]|uniref:glycine N-acyltransferase-like protein 3 isoform X2 n=1 Tax=Hemicordylus capensis TaxID=884348 RepID=UPI0023049DFD|nr:glycine N-acyltransferase-like protein 3 isoform X2 [Hemicordylus capensis]